jgi:hypothetical protein
MALTRSFETESPSFGVGPTDGEIEEVGGIPGRMATWLSGNVGVQLSRTRLG